MLLLLYLLLFFSSLLKISSLLLTAVSFSKSNCKSMKLSHDNSTEMVLIWPMCSVVYCLVWFSLIRFSTSKFDKLIRSKHYAVSWLVSEWSTIVSIKYSFIYFSFNSWLVMIYASTSCSKNWGITSGLCFFRFFFTVKVLLSISSSTC